MVKSLNSLLLISILFVLGACASKTKDRLNTYREIFKQARYEDAQKALDSSGLKEDKKSILLWHLEQGTVAFYRGDENVAITEFQESLALIDSLYTVKLKSKAASLFINDAADDFYGASYERSYAHYFLSKSYYSRYLKLKNKQDLQSARATILAWDSYFTELQRSASTKTFYQTDLMLKVFGGQIHEVSGISNDKQISLQLYKDALRVLDVQGGIFSAFNSKNEEYTKKFEDALKTGEVPSKDLLNPTINYRDLKNFLTYKILSLTKEIRPGDFNNQSKSLAPSKEVLEKANQGSGNLVVVLEEGLIPKKVGKEFNFGLKSALSSPEGKGNAALNIGAEVVTAFAMDKLGMTPEADPKGFVFAHSVTKMAVKEAAIEFELPMVENIPNAQELDVLILNEKNEVVDSSALNLISHNGDIAKVVLEEDAISRYVKTGTRVALRHLTAIVSAYGVYLGLKPKDKDKSDFFAKTAAVATYVAASKGLSMLEKADTRYWATLPAMVKMSEFKLPPGDYQVALAARGTKNPIKTLGKVKVDKTSKVIASFNFNP